MQLSHWPCLLGRWASCLRVGLGTMCGAPSIFSDLSLACPGPTHNSAEPGKAGVSSICSAERVKEEGAGYRMEMYFVQSKWEGV